MAEFADPFIFAFYFGDIVDDAGIEADAGIVGVIFSILEIAFIAVDRDGLILGGFGVGIEFAHGLKRSMRALPANTKTARRTNAPNMPQNSTLC